MRKIAIIILFLSFSCGNRYKEVTESKQILNVHNSQPFFGDFIYENKIDFYSDTMGIYLKHFNFSNNKKLESLLTNIYSRDQQYRDSVQIDNELNDLMIDRYWKKIIFGDKLNKEIVKLIISKVG